MLSGILDLSAPRAGSLHPQIRREGGESRLRRMDPVFRFPWESQPSHAEQGRFVAEITDTNGRTIRQRFDTLVAAEHDQQADGAFSVMLPVDPHAEIASLRITSADRTVQYAEMKRSKPPRIRIVSPQSEIGFGPRERGRGDRHEREGGHREGETTEVQWTVDDPDTPNSQLRFKVAYSADDGRSWVPLGVDIPGAERSFKFDSSKIPESAGDGVIRVIRVFVGDGLNTAFDDVTGLTR